MQFIQNGPDIPERLLQAHEEGRVVLFCGAGISYPAKLPGFGKLVDRIYEELDLEPTSTEQTALKANQFDTAIGLLEGRLLHGREEVRTAASRILTPDLTAARATDTHEALLTLARCRDGRTRLITTNFDRLFETIIERNKFNLQRFHAPLLPIPKSRWDGLVYLHGLLSSTPTANELDRLVLSSGDFGLAYLAERWAARFISELFRNYTVCFVGYSINDPVLRYMMDALAADRLLGESPPEMFAFGSYSKGNDERVREEWKAKNVTPILYREFDRHAYLHRTLKAWSKTYRDGVQGRERIVLEYAMTKPLASTKEDDYVGRMLWAVSHESGLPARRFAEFDPVPSLDWLEPLSDRRYLHIDLPRFGVPPQRRTNDKLSFSLTLRPAPYTHAPWMALVSSGLTPSEWDDVMFQLARWLVRHLDDPTLVLWLTKHGGQLHVKLASHIENELGKLSQFERENNEAELARIRANAPNAVPRPQMRVIWRLLLTGRVKSHGYDLDLYYWKDRFKRDGLTATVRFGLREILTPMILLKRPLRWREGISNAVAATRIKDLIDWELVLAADHVHSSLHELDQIENWGTALPILLSDFQQLLLDALDLLNELGEADSLSDRAYWDLPSISAHWQNRGFRDWVALIELVRDAWSAVYRNDVIRASKIAHDWFLFPYPTFKRLCLYAATFAGVTPNGEWVNWLLSDDGWWLWSVDTKRETMRLLVQQGGNIPHDCRTRLEAAILTGPPRRMYRDDVDAERWQELTDHAIWLALAKLASGNNTLGREAAAKLAELSIGHPNWQIASNERDEFSHWMTGTGDPDYEDHRETTRAPRIRRELMFWLQQPPSRDAFVEDDWSEVCRTQFSVAAPALYALARGNIWPEVRWREALQAWSDEKLSKRSWRYLGQLLLRMPPDTLSALADSISWWLESASKPMVQHQVAFMELCRRILSMQHGSRQDVDQPVEDAINHPIGHVTQALLNRWFSTQLEDDQGLPEEFKELFTQLCDTKIEQYRHARVLLAANVIALFRVDRDWAKTSLLPLFDWNTSAVEARAAWEGFLWSPRLYRPLVVAFKSNFLETARRYADLGNSGRQFAAILTYAALDPADTFTATELHAAVAALPQDGLQESASTLVQALEGSGAQREEYWLNRVQPYLRSIWPKSRQMASAPLAEQFAHLAIAARGEFPAALNVLRNWLQPIEHSHLVVHRLNESGLSSRFPKEAVALLDMIIDYQRWAPPSIGPCLEAVVSAWPEGESDDRFRRLTDYARQHGQG